MKTTVIRSALVTAIVAYALVDASGYCSDCVDRLPRSTHGLTLSFINFVTFGGIIVTSSIQCKTIDGIQAISSKTNKFVTFIVMNGHGVGETGVIMNTVLSMGIWEYGGRFAKNINNIKFDRKTSVTFSARSRDEGSGVEGSFEIHESGQKVAVVVFQVPYWGQNQLDITYHAINYACNLSGMTSSGCPTVEIICHKRKKIT